MQVNVTVIAALVVLLVSAVPALAVDLGSNLGFERVGEEGEAPAGWFVGDDGWDVVVDTTTAYEGESSLLIRSTGEGAESVEGDDDSGAASQRLSGPSLRPVAGKRLRLFGFIKTEVLEDGQASLWLRVDRGDERMALANMAGRGPSGTTGWTEFRVEVPVDRGNAAWNNRAPFSIDPAPAGTLESILHQAGRRYVYVDLSKAKRAAGTEWMDTPIVARLFGKNDVTMVVRDQYNGVLLIDTTWPPEYLPAADP